jgi:EmrB/QacA subfamily drug resistance transporter
MKLGAQAAPGGVAGEVLGVPYKWVALTVTTVGALMFAIDTSIVVLALPAIMADLHADLISAIWVLMGYSLMSTVALLTFGRLADLLGRVRMYNLGFVVFTVASVLCGLAANSEQLILFRILQGLGGAMLLANSMAIITEAFPAHERGRAMGINSVVWAVGNIAGPIFGGLILATTTWRWIFLVNLPIGVIATIAAWRLLKEISTRNVGEKFEPIGAGLFSLALVALLVALNQGIALGWTDPLILGLFGASLVLAVAFYLWNRSVANPVLDFGLFANRVFTAAVAAATFQSLAIFAVTLLVVYFLQVIQGQSAWAAALALVPFSVLNSVLGPIGGALSDRLGARRPVMLGLLLQTAGLVVLATLQVHSGYFQVVAGLVLVGSGGGLFWAPNTSATMGAAPPNRLGVASATLATWRNTGMVVSYALSLAIAAGAVPPAAQAQLFLGLSVHMPAAISAEFVNGMRAAFRLSILICLATAVGWWIAAAPADQPTPRHADASSAFVGRE